MIRLVYAKNMSILAGLDVILDKVNVLGTPQHRNLLDTRAVGGLRVPVVESRNLADFEVGA